MVYPNPHPGASRQSPPNLPISARWPWTEAPLLRAAFSPDGTTILTYNGDWTLSGGKSARLWDARTARPICTLARHDLGIRSAGFSPDSRSVLISFHGQPSLTRVWLVDFPSEARARRPRDLMPDERARFELPTP
jgi:WD40 repeat protein